MPSYRLDLAYDGTGFRGYARQDGQRTIQGELETALKAILGTSTPTTVAGRTDAGVHAKGQVVSFEIEQNIDAPQLARSLNGVLGPEISVSDVNRVDDDFNARFSATYRRYRYLVSVALASDPLTRHQVWHVGRSLDIEAMTAVATAVVGEHDFSAFCRSVAGKSNVRLVDEARWESADHLLTFWIQSNAFCHQMVRSLVGFAYDIGRGFTAVDSISEIIDAGDRSRIATIAPPHGLTLWEVGY
ncbi:MAG: tRNA pseudouridine(38-40) synthase TruA [Actinomycetota bacterium]|nr:tRNA pseudouridine(38-40) synthase TruA [Actinomycetota bacterium]